jgi:hypothetical protein
VRKTAAPSRGPGDLACGCCPLRWVLHVQVGAALPSPPPLSPLWQPSTNVEHTIMSGRGKGKTSGKKAVSKSSKAGLQVC